MKNKTAIMTFVENTNPVDPKLDNEASVFSIPYKKIIEAEDFCQREDLDYCYVGYQGFIWRIRVTNDDLMPFIQVTKKGIAKEDLKKYTTTVLEI